jgi:hypothetical protein
MYTDAFSEYELIDFRLLTGKKGKKSGFLERKGRT